MQDASRKNKNFSSDPLLSLTLGLLHVSAMGGVTDIGTSVPEAYMALSYRLVVTITCILVNFYLALIFRVAFVGTRTALEFNAM